MLLTYSSQQYVIDAANICRDVRAVVVVVANSAQYGNGARIAPGARVDDGELDLVVVEESSRFVTICQTPRLFTGVAWGNTPVFDSAGSGRHDKVPGADDLPRRWGAVRGWNRVDRSRAFGRTPDLHQIVVGCWSFVIRQSMTSD